MNRLTTAASPSVPPRQLSIPFEAGRLCGLSAPERRTVLTQLTHLLQEAAGVATEERDDDER